MANHWWEIKIVTHPALEEILFWRLENFGCQGMMSEAKGTWQLVQAYLPQVEAEALDLAALSLWLRQDAVIMGMPKPKTSWSLIDEQDWASSWKQHWHPQKIGDRVLICPAWLSPSEKTERVVLRLDPGVAFGTGIHPTTQLCLEALEMRYSHSNTGGVLADIGCGSGILSVASLLLGAEKVYAVDNDPIAIRSTQDNRELNQIDSEKLLIDQGSIERVSEMATEGVDGILCNILAEVIIELIPQFSAIAKPHTWGILSGILMDKAEPVSKTLEQHGWTIASLWRRQQWCCLNIRRQKPHEKDN